MIIDGHPNDEKAAREFQYSFDGKQFAYVRNGKEVSKGSYDLDVTKSPAAIDLLEPTGVRIYGIYRVEKDKLTLCLSEDRRPSDFEPGRRRILAIALRQQ